MIDWIRKQGRGTAGFRDIQCHVAWRLKFSPACWILLASFLCACCWHRLARPSLQLDSTGAACFLYGTWAIHFPSHSVILSDRPAVCMQCFCEASYHRCPARWYVDDGCVPSAEVTSPTQVSEGMAQHTKFETRICACVLLLASLLGLRVISLRVASALP